MEPVRGECGGWLTQTVCVCVCVGGGVDIWILYYNE